jgi:[ribosomal protein S5]-alanine N-acetyltransferase
VIGPVETPRLTGEPVTLDHHGALCALLGDPRVGATLGGTRTPDQVAEWIARHVEKTQQDGLGYWVWRERATGDVVARGGLSRMHVGGRDEVEVGWVVMPERWGEGFATELGTAAVGVAFETLGITDVVAFTLPENRASRRVMDKLGFEYERDVEHAGLPHVLYRRTSVA